MPRYLRYPLLALLFAAAVFFAFDVKAPSTDASETAPAAAAPQPNYLITDASLRPAE